jgi:acetyl-CoA carboxylase biotin carboxyl carrier protein
MSHNIESQVSGTVWKVEKPSGQPVTEGEVILIVESMKMEVPHEAVGAGTVTVLVAEGEVVKEGQLLAKVS